MVHVYKLRHRVCTFVSSGADNFVKPRAPQFVTSFENDLRTTAILHSIRAPPLDSSERLDVLMRWRAHFFTDERLKLVGGINVSDGWFPPVGFSNLVEFAAAIAETSPSTLNSRCLTVDALAKRMFHEHPPRALHAYYCIINNNELPILQVLVEHRMERC